MCASVSVCVCAFVFVRTRSCAGHRRDAHRQALTSHVLANKQCVRVQDPK